ncbi:MAG TPA: choice-of-anchor E domain-containing protein [Candidatus Limnocylindria bacterium]|jgi:hypothetical protein|nr:choice-of-anchor E domain-containing protein [Candidatus Limnocylindria bacterium]
MNKQFIAAVIAGSAMAVSAFADTESFSYSVPTTTTTWTQVINVDQFNTSLGTLTSVSYTISGTLTGTAQASNNSTTSEDNVELNLKATLKLTRPDNTTLVQSVPLTTTSVTLAVWDGNGATPHYTPPSGITLEGLSVSYTQTSSTTAPLDLALFSGTGTIPLNMKATGNSFGAGDSGNDTFNFTTLANAQVDIVYTYSVSSPVPEAGTWAAIGFAGLAGGVTYFRRRQAKA